MESIIRAIVDCFNEARELDPHAMQELRNFRVKVNQHIYNHDSIQVDAKNTISFLGLLNGALMPNGIFIAEIWDDNMENFLRYDILMTDNIQFSD